MNDSEGTHARLLADHELESIRAQWKEIQAEFVDEPRKAVQEADALSGKTMLPAW